MKHEIVCVDWDDAAIYHETQSFDYDFTHKPLRTVGWKVKEDEQYIVIAHDYSPEDNTVRHTTVIPKAICTHIQHIHVGRKRTKRKK